MPGSDFFMETLCAKGIAQKSYSYVRNNHPNYPNKALGTSANTVFHGQMTQYYLDMRFEIRDDSVILVDKTGNIIDDNTLNAITEWYKRYSVKEKKGTFLATLSNVNTGAGFIASTAELFDKEIILGSKYIKINAGGTVVNNPNRTFTTVKNVASKVGKRILAASYFFDLWAFLAGEKTITEATLNSLINTGIYIVGCAYPPAGIIMGLAYLSMSGGRPEAVESNYEKIHGTITPRDNTKVTIPQKLLPTRYREVSNDLHFYKNK